MIAYFTDGIKKNKKVVCFILVVIPFGVYILSEVKGLPVCGTNDWAGFWGGYLGAIIGGVITLYVMRETINSENNARRRDEKIAFFDNITKLSAELSSLIKDFCISISRDRAENDNDLHERSLLINNSIIKLIDEISILLETRKSVYNVDTFIDRINEINETRDKIQTRYEDAIKVRFHNPVYNDLLDKNGDLIVEQTEQYIIELKQTIKDNLFID